jgi:hypothetical protein
MFEMSYEFAAEKGTGQNKSTGLRKTILVD